MSMHNEKTAYPAMPDWDDHNGQVFEIGDRVSVGPSYRMGGTYQSDGCEGIYFIHKLCSNGLDYYLTRARDDDHWALVVSVSRLQRVAR